MSNPLVIGWLYGAAMNIYGDRGNVMALSRRASWRGFDVEVKEIGFGEPIPDDIDVFFWGGGQDQEQEAVSRDIQGDKGKQLIDAVEHGAALLSICGGYQLLGHEYRPHDAAVLPGISLFDVTSVAGPTRFIGNVVLDSPTFGTLVGFENHSGLTTLGPTAKPLGQIRIGNGNNGKDGTEGCVYKSAIGCYLHGALLPKNPLLTDWLIERGFQRRRPDFMLADLANEIEQNAHESAIARATMTH